MFEPTELPEILSDLVNAFAVVVDPKEFDSRQFADNCSSAYSYCNTRLSEFRDQMREIASYQYRYASVAYSVSRMIPV